MIQFLITAILIELTPGPNMAWIAMLGAMRGHKTALLAVLGIALGLSIAGAASVFGVATIISTNSAVFNFLRWGGALYLLYLAWDSYQVDITNVQNKAFDKSQLRYFFQGLISNILNPKAYLVFAIIIPQFVNSAMLSTPLTQLIILSAIYVLIATIIHVVLALLGGAFNKFFEEPKHLKLLGKIFAALLAICAFWFLYSTNSKL
jgi:threonine/homoserine/homoserine lactone efflux protein